MTASRFRSLAKQIAGQHWRTKLGPMIGKGRSMVFEYATGKRPVPETVAKLMLMLAGKEK